MVCYFTLYLTVIVTILHVILFTESSRCSKNFIFDGLQLNSSISSDFCSLSIESNNETNQTCVVMLRIDFSTDFVNGLFATKEQSSGIVDRLDVTTHFH